tara:strand:+ start:1589 stop:2095 length:507 start_codon:yes stop_codon:yes gene_type:complete
VIFLGGRLPVDGKKVIEHRISFGTFERNLLSDFVATKSFQNAATPIISLMKDVTGMATLYLILNFLFPNWDLGIDLDSIPENGLRDYLEVRNIAGSAIGIGIAAYATGGLSLIPSIIGLIGGQIIAEGTEEIEEDVKSAILPAYRGISFMLSLRNASNHVGYSDRGDL